MCQHWLCRQGDNGICYFTLDDYGHVRGTGEVTPEEWDEMDADHGESGSHRVAFQLGVRILEIWRRVDAEPYAEQTRRQLLARYADRPRR